jgi:hypothetical protein
MRHLWGVLVLAMAVGCGSSSSDCDEAHEEVDELNRKATGHDGACNVCSDECGGGQFWGVWTVSVDRDGKRRPGEEQECTVKWFDVPYGTRDDIEDDYCTSSGK